MSVTTSPAVSQIPVTVLTGYLGAGKTTLLNRILSESHGKKYAVVINEFGELGVDNDLVIDADEEVFEMNNGCICCTVRGDLIRIVNQLVKRKGQLDGIIIETTGLADPSPVAQTFFVDEQVKTRSRLDAIVTVVDAKHLLARLADSHEAEEQVAFADVIVLNKTDLVTPEELAVVEARIRSINHAARIMPTQRAEVPIADLLDRGSFDLGRILEMEPDFLTGEDDHAHDDAVTSVSLTSDAPLDMQRFHQWIGDVLAEKGQDLLRTKGILQFKDDNERFAFQAVHMIADGDYIGPWKAGDPRQSRIVFIGRELNRPELRRGFEACATA
ncbi:CobW family GTP-binding protein [Rhodopila sp.]|uniref:CobW family GTP-binding protein n=1 Tax=Rhodopila sp. TaxID=2480087 RepID=UPI003D0FA659